MQRCRRAERGFTLIEVLVVLAIAGVLIAMSALYFSQMQTSAAIEKQVTNIYTTLMQVRLEALYTKTPRTVTFSGKQMKVYATSDTSVAPLSTWTFSYPMATSSGANSVAFDAAGMMLQAEGAICVDPSGSLADNPATRDSVEIGAVKTFMGKRQSGELCVPASIDQK